MATLLEKTRKITAILQEGLNNSGEELPYKGLSERLSAVIDCNSVVIDGHGDVLGYAMPYKTNKTPCAQPVYLTAKGISAQYFNGIAINTNIK